MTFDQAENPRNDFIGAVDGKVELRLLGQGGERDIQAAGLLFGLDGGGNAHDSETLIRDAARQRSDKERGGGTGTKAENHAIFNQREGGVRRGVLPSVLFGVCHSRR